jgi:hypothetical protein
MSLHAIKLLHTFAWALFAGCIVALPIVAWQGRFGAAMVLAGVVMIEVLILAFNRFRCPLTAVAARYTDDRRDNFDIYLPLWLASHNKVVFGTLYAGGLVFIWVWWRLAQASSPS